jgi:hypothetical protein
MSDNRHPTCADWVGCVFALILSLGALPANAGVLSTTDVLAKTGQSIDAWGAAWWQNAFVHPDLLGDTTGEFGYLGNVGGPVFFAEGSGGDPVSLSYTVPNNQYILLPVATYIWTFFDPCASVGCARTIVNSFVSGITDAFASIDGVPVADLTSHLVTVDTTTPFVFQVDAGPIGPDGYGGILDAVQGGLWLMLDPLSSGMHTLTFGATVPSLDPFTGDVLDGSIELATNLQLTAVPEPSTVVLLCGGLALAFGLRRSRAATTKQRKTPRLLSFRGAGVTYPNEKDGASPTPSVASDIGFPCSLRNASAAPRALRSISSPIGTLTAPSSRLSIRSPHRSPKNCSIICRGSP